MRLALRSARPTPSVLVLLIAALTGCGPSRPVTVAAILHESFVEATRWAYEDAAAGLPPVDTSFVSEESIRAEPILAVAGSVAATPGLIAVIGHSASGPSISAAPIYNNARVVQIAPTATAPEYSETGPFSFRLVPSDTVQGAVLARAIDSLYPEGARLAVLHVNDEYGVGLRDAVLRHLDSLRHTVVFIQPHIDLEDGAAAERDARSQRTIRATIAGVRAADAQLVLWLGRGRTLHAYLPELRRVLGAMPVLGGDGTMTDRMHADAALWAGVRFATYFDIAGTPALRAFRHRRAEAPLSEGEVLSYDAMQLILAAVRDGARTGEEVRLWLHALGRTRPAWQGLSGPIRFSESGEVDRSYVIVERPATAPTPSAQP